MNEVERRYTRQIVELRADSESRKIGGYAAKFGRLSEDLGGFREQIDPAFFNKSKGDGWPGVVARYQHDDNYLLGTSGAGTLRLSVDQTGLAYDVDVPHAREDVFELVQRGDVRASSFAFVAFEDDFERNNEGVLIRTLYTGKLFDVAPVVTPAYPDATVGLRSLARQFDAEYEEVRALARANELDRLFVRTDRPSVTPTDTRSAKSITELRRDLLAKNASL
ncbi:MAG: HK97 family phage prohead protease [Propionibacteriales bacterium]|nr:HK97 family phage prohead protease [Propionibacteriales bacterium]